MAIGGHQRSASSDRIALADSAFVSNAPAETSLLKAFTYLLSHPCAPNQNSFPEIYGTIGVYRGQLKHAGDHKSSSVSCSTDSRTLVARNLIFAHTPLLNVISNQNGQLLAPFEALLHRHSQWPFACHHDRRVEGEPVHSVSVDIF